MAGCLQRHAVKARQESSAIEWPIAHIHYILLSSFVRSEIQINRYSSMGHKVKLKQFPPADP
jgi:hypothetical protein